jgi:hypothetical protein
MDNAMKTTGEIRTFLAVGRLNASFASFRLLLSLSDIGIWVTSG